MSFSSEMDCMYPFLRSTWRARSIPYTPIPGTGSDLHKLESVFQRMEGFHDDDML